MINPANRKKIAWGALALCGALIGAVVFVATKEANLQFLLGILVGILGNVLSTVIWDVFIKPALTKQADGMNEIPNLLKTVRALVENTKTLARVHVRSDTALNDEISTAALQIAQKAAQYWILAASGNVASFRLEGLAKKASKTSNLVTFVVEHPQRSSNAEKVLATLGFLASYVATRGKHTPDQTVTVRVYFSIVPIRWHVEFGGEQGIGGLLAFSHGHTSRRYYEFLPGDPLAEECNDALSAFVKEAESSRLFLTMTSAKGYNAQTCLDEAIRAMGDADLRSFLLQVNPTKAASERRPHLEAMRVFPVNS